MPAPSPSKVTVQEIERLCARELPWVELLGLRIEELQLASCLLRLPRRDAFLRPGGTISGPAMMGLADFSLYVAVLSAVGMVPLAVTTSLSINFLRKPPPGDILARARLLKLGKRLAYGEVFLYEQARLAEGAAGGWDEPVAHATGTYSVPPTPLLDPA